MLSPGWVDLREESRLFMVVMLFGFIGAIVELTASEEEHEERMALYNGVKEVAAPAKGAPAANSPRQATVVRKGRTGP